MTVKKGEPAPRASRRTPVRPARPTRRTTRDGAAALRRDLEEAQAHQRAIAEILEGVSKARGDVQPVLDAIVASAAGLTDAYSSAIFRVEGDHMTVVAARQTFHAQLGRIVPIDSKTAPGMALQADRTVHIADVGQYPHLPQGAPRTRLAVPIRTSSGPYGVLIVGRREVQPFTERQIDLMETFAREAGIAIVNVRLFNDTKEALEQQIATAEILKVMSTNTTDLQPVLDVIVQRAGDLAGAESTLIFVREPTGEFTLRAGAYPDTMRDFWDRITTPFTAAGPGMRARTVREQRVDYQPDLALHAPPDSQLAARAAEAGLRSSLSIPLLQGGEAIGMLGLQSTRPNAFSDRLIATLSSFADQAVIAMSNVRLFNETKEALERQTVIAEVMKAINSSVGDLPHVLAQVVEQATRLAEAENGFVYQVRGDVLQMTAAFGDKAAAMREWQREHPIEKTNVGTSTGRAFTERLTVHIPDVLADPAYTYHEAQELGGFRVLLSVPMIRDGQPLGVLALWRTQPRPFADAQIKVVELLSEQALVAIENARLLDETQRSLQQQTAIAEVLKTISRSAFDLNTVLGVVVENAAQLCDATGAWISSVDGDEITVPALARYGVDATGRALADIMTRGPRRQQAADVRSIMSRPVAERRTIVVEDLQNDPTLSASTFALRIGTRSALAVPLMREGRVIGVFVLARYAIRPFSDREVRLAETFADQAAIAIENVRLFNEIHEKSRQLEVASRHKSEFLANMSHELRTPLNAIIGFTDVMLQEMFGPLNSKQKEYLEDVRGSGTHLLSLINDILDLSKIEAGRVDLEPSQFSLAEAIQNALTLVRERAARHGIALSADVSPNVGSITADERKIKQVLVNLLTNAVKFTRDGGRVAISATCDGSHVHVAVRDSGIGIAPDDQERVFEEFQQVGKDPERSREGTGLGLTLSKRFVELHGGRIWLESEVGKGSTFTFTIPLEAPAIPV